MREEVKRKMDLKKAQYRNKKQMLKKQYEPASRTDEKLIEKVGIPDKTKL